MGSFIQFNQPQHVSRFNWRVTARRATAMLKALSLVAIQYVFEQQSSVRHLVIMRLLPTLLIICCMCRPVFAVEQDKWQVDEHTSPPSSDSFVYAELKETASSPDVDAALHKKELILGIEHAPPYVLSKQNSGFEVEIIRAALRAVGYRLRVEYMPTGRGVRLLINKRVDIVSPIYHEDRERFYLSQTHIYHRPSLFSLATNDIEISAVEDVSSGSVAAYQGALTGFGAKFQHIARQCPLFVELTDSGRIVDMLYRDRVDLAILDLHTFQYFLKANELDDTILRVHDLIEPIAAGAAFHDNLMKRKFEKGVRIILGNGEYERIASNYLDKHSVTQMVELLELTLTSH